METIPNIPSGISIGGIFKVIGLMLGIAGFMFIFIVPLINDIIYGSQNNDWKPLIDDTAGKIFNSEQAIKEDVNLLSNQTTINSHPERFDKKYVSYVKSEIVMNLAIMFSWFILFFWVFKKIFRKFSNMNLFERLVASFTILGLTLISFAVLELLYAWFVNHHFIIPFQGILTLIWNPQIWAFTGFSGVALTGGSAISGIGGNPIIVKDFTEDKPFEAVKNIDGTDVKVDLLGHPKKLVEFFCKADNDCISYFGNDKSKCQTGTGLCYT